MKLKVTHFFVLGLIIVQSCSRQHKIEDQLLVPKVKTEKIGEKKFPLDSTTSANSLSLYFEYNDKRYFTLLNKYLNAIYIYDYDDETLKKIVKYPVSGPGSVGKIQGYYIKNEDSIFVHGKSGLRLFLSNIKGEVYREFDLSNDKGYVKPSSFSGNMPITIENDFLYMNAWGHQREYYQNSNYPESLILKLDLKTGNSIRYGAYPSSYRNNGVWGIQFHTMWNTMNEVNGDMILSFPNSDSLMVIDNSGSAQMIDATSTTINSIQPMSTRDRFSPKDPMIEIKNYETQNTYEGVYYDKYRKLIYRYVNLEMNEEDFDNQHPIRSRNQKKNLIILNSEYELIGELTLDSTYTYHTSPTFINQFGFHINKGKYESEDILKFDILKFHSNE